MQTRPIEMLLSERQFQILQTSVTQAVTRKWLRTKDLPDYLGMADSTIRENLPGFAVSHSRWHQAL